MELRKNRKLTVAVSALLALVIVISATLAWITAKDTKVNHFENQGYITDGSVSVVEEFDKPTDWKPGMEVNKNVYVANTGAGDVLVRVAFEEMLKILGNNGDVTTDEEYATVNGQHPEYGAGNPVNNLIVAKVEPSTYKYVGDNNGTTAGNDEWVKLDVNLDSALTGYSLPTTGLTILKSKAGDALVAFYEYDSTNHLYQSVRVSDHTVNTMTNTITLKEKLEYTYFTEGAAEFYSWNKNNNVNSAPWNSQDYTGLAIPGSNATGTSQLTDKVTLNYVGLATADASNANKWYYSAADGYFYYLGTVGSGVTTTKLLDSVKMLGSAEKSFTKVEYDLAVTVEAIQATKEALGVPGTASAGWQISDSNLLQLLQNEYCVD